MKWILSTILIIHLSGCTTFNHIEAINPDVGYLTEDVNTILPTLEWDLDEHYTGTYDLVIYTRGEVKRWGKSNPQEIVYFKKGIQGTSHKITQPLNENYRYYWAVKMSNDNSEDAWARYNYYFFGGFFAFWWLDAPFRFDIDLTQLDNSSNSVVAN